MRRSNTSRIRGFSLIEAAIVLGIVGLVIGGIWVAASKVNQERQLDQIVRTISHMQEKLSLLYNDQRPVGPGVWFAVSSDLLASAIPADTALDSNGYVLLPMGFSISGVVIEDAHISYTLGHDNGGTPEWVKPCQLVANKLSQVFRKQNKAALTEGFVSNVIGGANDLDLSTPSLSAANCGSEDSIMLLVDY